MFKSPETISVFLAPIAPIAPNCPEDAGTGCTQCGACVPRCRFLSKYGPPAKLVEQYASNPDFCRTLAFECSLCGLCSSICPLHLDIPGMMLKWRQEAVASGSIDLSPYRRILRYEKTGCSKRFSLYSLPMGCDTVFFPGCTLAGTRPKTTLNTYNYLRTRNACTGIVLDCCTKPSHDLGRQIFFKTMFSGMVNFLKKNGVTTIVTACPSCRKIFDRHSSFKVRSLYRIMAEDPVYQTMESPGDANVIREAMVQDPCQARHDTGTQTAVRTLARNLGIHPVDSRQSRKKTLCCGEGASAGCLNPGMADAWSRKRLAAAKGKLTLTYCAGCVTRLSGKGQSLHMLDLAFDRDNALAGKPAVSRPPFTYVNRLRLKTRLKRLPGRRMNRERPFSQSPPASQSVFRALATRSGRLLSAIITALGAYLK